MRAKRRPNEAIAESSKEPQLTTAAVAKAVEVQRHKIEESLMGGLYSNIHKKRKRIAKGSKESMRKPGSKGAPTAKAFRQAKKTAKKK